MFDFIRLVYGLFVVPYTSHFGYHVSADVFVKDTNGVPITNAVVKIVSESSCSLAINSRAPDYDTYAAKTGTNGIAVVEFRCPTGRFEYSVTAPGYYTERKKGPDFKTRESLLSFDLVERQKRLEQVLYKIRNPIKMVEHSERENPRMPMDNGTFGFDLQKSDWLPPYGMGDVADFWIDYKVVYENGGKETYHARMYFTDPGAGFYVRAKNKSYRFWSDYRADANAHYERERSSFDAVNTSGGRKDIIGDGEYLVLRTRTKVDKDGKIVSAHYSRMFGTVGFSTRFYTGGYSFNPHPNDTNLESDSY